MDLCLYRIDAEDRIVDVGGDWNRFAIDNDGGDLRDADVLGTSIWDHIHGAEVRLLYEVLFARVRERRQELQVPFRCDAPRVIRSMRLTMLAGADGGIRFAGELIERRERPPVDVLDPRVARGAGSLDICSVCRQVRVDEQRWTAVESAIGELRLFSKAPPALHERVCPRCDAGARSAG